MRWNIPTLPADLLSPVRALTRAASLFRRVLLETMQGVSLGDALAEREEALRLADRVVDQGADYFGVGADAEEDTGNGQRR